MPLKIFLIQMISKIITKSLVFFIIFFHSSVFANQEKDLMIGNASAKISMEVFSSPTCPHCANFHLEVVPDLIKNYTSKGKLIIIHKDFPLDLQGLNAGKISKCIQQDKLLEFFNTIYSEQRNWSSGKDIKEVNNKLKKIALKFNMTEDQFDKCMINEKNEELVLKSRIEGTKKYNVNATPTIIINGKKYTGEYSYKAISKYIETLQ